MLMIFGGGEQPLASLTATVYVVDVVGFTVNGVPPTKVFGDHV